MKLTRKERSDVLHGDWPRIVRDKKPCELGAVIQVSTQVTLEALAVVRTKKGQWRIDYLVRDERPDLLRHIPPTYGGKRGQIDAPTASEIEYARIDSSYTHSLVGAVPDAGSPVPASFQNVLTIQGRDRHARYRDTDAREQLAEERAQHAAKVIRDTAMMIARSGSDPVEFLAEVQRLASRRQDEHRDAA